MPDWKNLSLKLRIALAVSALFVAAASAIAVWALALFETETRDELSRDAATLAAVISDNLDAKLQMAHGTLIAVAATVPVRALQDYAESEGFLQNQVALHALFDLGLFLVAPDGRLIGSSPPRPERRGSDVSQREYFHQTLATRKPYISKPYRSTHRPGQPALIMTAPVFGPTGDLIGLLYGSMDLLGSNVLADMAKLRIGRTGYVFLTAGRESMITHPNPGRIMQPAPKPGQNLLFDRAIDGFEGSGETVNSVGIAALQTYRRVKSTGWILGVSLPLAEFYDPIREARSYFLYSTAAGTLLFLVMVWLLSGRLIAPLSTMTRQVRQMAVNPDGAGRLQVGSADEIGVLGEAFNGMLDQLRQLNEELERRVAARTADLVQARDEAERANRAKSDFLSAMSHDLRTPLNAVLGFSQLLESDTKDRLSERHRAQVREIRRAGAHLLALINDILDLARVEAGKQPISVEPVHLSALIDECLGLMEPVAREQGIRLPARCGAGCDRHVSADRTRLKQVLLNLLSNAVKYNRPQGSVEIDCSEVAPGQIEIGISDTGPGLAPQEIERLFRPFERLGADAGGVQGAGIGLVLSQRLVALMHGRLGVDSVPGQGSRFWIHLDRAEPAQLSLGRSAAAAAAATAPGAAAGTRTLVYIEDNPVNAQLMEALIEQEPGWRMVHAAQPESGLDLAETLRPDLILLDIQLPAMNGFEVLRRLRAAHATKDIPVVALTASAMQGEVEKGLAAGFRHYLTKPLDVQQLRQLLRQVARDQDPSTERP